MKYYNRFLPNLSTWLTPLYALLQKLTTCKWSTKCQKAFEEMKALITSEQELTQFNPELPLTSACDASPYGLGLYCHTLFQKKSNEQSFRDIGRVVQSVFLTLPSITITGLVAELQSCKDLLSNSKLQNPQLRFIYHS